MLYIWSPQFSVLYFNESFAWRVSYWQRWRIQSLFRVCNVPLIQELQNLLETIFVLQVNMKLCVITKWVLYLKWRSFSPSWVKSGDFASKGRGIINILSWRHLLVTAPPVKDAALPRPLRMSAGAVWRWQEDELTSIPSLGREIRPNPQEIFFSPNCQLFKK